MKRIVTLVLLLTSCMMASAQSGYKIPITLKPYKNTQVYLGYYYGKVKALADSARNEDPEEVTNPWLGQILDHSAGSTGSPSGH